MEIVPEKKLIKVGEKDFYIKKFSIIQGTRFVKWIMKAVMLNSDKINDVKDKFVNNESNSDDLMLLVSMLNDDMILELMSICLNTDDIEYLKENLSLDKGLEVIAEVVTLNDIGGILKNFQRTVATVTEKIKIDKK